jgi:hypothetical protein
MSSARIDKLKTLLKRVEERRAQPRLHAVSARETSATVPDLARAEPPQAEPPRAAAPARAPSPAPLLESIEPPTMPPVAAEPARKAGPSITPLESAMAQLDDSGPLQLEPAPAARAGGLPAAEMLDEAPVELTQPRRTPERAREPTIEFETAKVRVHARELRAVGEPMAAPPEAPVSGPSHTFEPTPLAQDAQPVRSVSAPRAEVPKTFGELLQQSPLARPAERSPLARPTERSPLARPTERSPLARPTERSPLARPTERSPLARLRASGYTPSHAAGRRCWKYQHSARAV